MSERILVCDKSIPFAGMVSGELRKHNAAVALIRTSGPEESSPTEQLPPQGMSSLTEVSWTRPTQLSAKTVLLEARNSLQSIDSALIIFDAQAFLASQSSEIESIPALLDEYIDGYLFLVRELTSFFLHQKKGGIVFALRSFPPRPVLPGSSETVFAIAEAAFTRLAEETASYYSSLGSSSTSCSLISLGDGDDTEDATWLAEMLVSQEFGRGLSRGGVNRWIRAGSRGASRLLPKLLK